MTIELCTETANLELTVHRAADIYEVFDRVGLAELVRQAIEERFDGNASRAARSINRAIERYCQEQGEREVFGSVSQSELSRLMAGRRPRITEKTLYALVILIDDVEGLKGALLSPRARDLLKEAERSYENRPLARSNELRERREAVLADMRAAAPAEFQTFDEFVRGQGHDPQEVDLALDRMIEPLVIPSVTGLDREWNELTADERADYVKWGLRREQVLLKRPPNLQRAQENRFLRMLSEAAPVRRLRLQRAGINQRSQGPEE